MSEINSENYGTIAPMLNDLEALVRCESPTEDVDACNKVMTLASQIALRVVGDAGKILQVQGRPVFWLGDSKPKIVLLGHLDTVWPHGSFDPLWDVTGDVIRGPGVFDMKAGFIQALYALKGIKGSVAIVATSDEETGSATSKALIQELSHNSTIVLVLEASLDGRVKTGRKGTSMYQIEVQGRAAHAGLEPEKGINATTEISHIVLGLAALEDSEFGTTVVPTMMKSGNTTNTVPDRATLDIDARSFSQAELARVDVAIRKFAPVNAEAKIVVGGGMNRPPLEPTSTQEIYKIAEKVAARMGISLGSANVGGASDGNFAAAAGARVLDGLGAVGSGAHARNEWASVAALEERSNFLHELVLELLND